MMKTLRGAFVIAAVLATNVAGYFVLTRNLEAGVYPVDGDSIGIGLYSGVVWSLAMLLFLLPPALMRWTSTPALVVQIVLIVLGGSIAALNALYWADPHHRIICGAYVAVAGVAVWLAVSRLLELMARQGERIERST